MRNIQFKTLLLLCFMALTAINAKAQTILYDFSFNNSLSSSVGSGVFSNTGVTFTTGRQGGANTAIRLNNTGTTATLTGLPYSNASRSVAAWVKMDALQNNFNFIYSYGTTNNADGLFITPSSAVHFMPNHSRAATFNTTSWFHLVVTYNGSASRIYVNGVLLGTTNVSKNTINNSNIFRLGLTESGATGYFSGVIDDLKIYSGALSDQQVTALFNICNIPLPTGTTPTANLTICSGSTTTLSAQSDSVLNWFDSASGGTSLGSGNTFITPALTTTTTYFVEAGLDCKSVRLPITVNVISGNVPTSPQIITDTTRTYCTGTRLALSARGFGVLRWYDAPTGGNLLGSGDTLITAPLQNNLPQGQVAITTYYVESVNPCSNPQNSVRTPVNIKVNGSFVFTNLVSPDSLITCSGSTIRFMVNTNADSLRWTLNGTLVSQIWTFVTAPITSNQTYILTAIRNGVCTRQEFYQVQVYNPYNIAPTNTSGALPTFCSRDTVMLSATTQHNAPLYWFTAPTGGTAYHIGDTALTIVAGAHNASTTTYYVQSGFGNCASPRTPITFGFTYSPIGTISLNGTTISALNRFDTYQLLRDGQVVAQSNTTGNITFQNATCGKYQAVFTNTVNTPCNGTSLFKISRNPTVYGNNCYTFRFDGVSGAGTLLVSVGGGPFGSESYYDGTQTAFIANVCNVTTSSSLTFRFITLSGCIYQISSNFSSIPTASTQAQHNGLSFVQSSNVGFDTLTTCNIRSNIINVGLNQPTNFTSSGNLSVCKGQATSLYATGTGTLRWYSQPTGGFLLDSGPQFNTPAIFANTTFYVEASSGNCTSPRTPITVTLRSSPTAAISPAAPTICAGKSIDLTVSGGDWYNWIDTTSNLSTLKVAPTRTTTYRVAAILNNGCSDTASVTVAVKQTSASSLAETVCFGQTTTFRGQTIGQSGIYRDTLTNAIGCDSIITLNFTVRPKAERIINAGICTGQSYTFKGVQLTQTGQYFDTLTTITGCDSFIVLNLSVNNFVLGSASVAICQGQSYNFNGRTLTQAGQYTDTLVSVAGCDSILTLTLSVNALPQPTITRNGNLLSTQTFASYQWRFNGNNISNATNQTLTVTENGNYSVVVADTNSCFNTSDPLNVVVVGLQDLKSNQLNLNIYPNPSSTVLNIESNETIQSIQIIDLLGRIIVSKDNVSELTSQLSTHELTPSTYFVQIKTNSGKTVVKSFVKQ